VAGALITDLMDIDAPVEIWDFVGPTRVDLDTVCCPVPFLIIG